MVDRRVVAVVDNGDVVGVRRVGGPAVAGVEGGVASAEEEEVGVGH